MYLKAFSYFIKNDVLEKHKLYNTTVVFDGQNFFYNAYKESGLQYIFGCESDKFAEYLKERLEMFTKSDIQCYFIFKGGHTDIEKKCKVKVGPTLGFDHINLNIVPPIFMKEVYKQVLDELGFPYTVCELESMKECIAFAQSHDCPVISNDIKFCFSGVPYIPYTTLEYKAQECCITCGMFDLNNFLKKFQLTQDKLAIFSVLTDLDIFPDNTFSNLFKSLNIHPINYYKRIKGLLFWLSKTENIHIIFKRIFTYNSGEKTKIMEEFFKVKNMIQRQEKPGEPTKYLDHKIKEMAFKYEHDNLWFEKGIAAKWIAIPLINVRRSAIVFGSWAIADKTDQDALKLSMDIIIYAFNLLTNYEKTQLIFVSEEITRNTVMQKTSVSVTGGIRNPFMFDDGKIAFAQGWQWEGLKKAFIHFLNESLQPLNLSHLDKIPEDARLLMIALIYFSSKKTADMTDEVVSVLTSYIALGVLYADEPPNDTSHKTEINNFDKNIAKEILFEYFAKVDANTAKEIFNFKLLHPLVEFQHCLQYINYLNKLCGSPYLPTIYSKTYNGTFVYKVLYAIRKETLYSWKSKLEPTPSVLAFLDDLLKVYKDIMYAR